MTRGKSPIRTAVYRAKQSMLSAEEKLLSIKKTYIVHDQEAVDRAIKHPGWRFNNHMETTSYVYVAHNVDNPQEWYFCVSSPEGGSGYYGPFISQGEAEKAADSMAPIIISNIARKAKNA